MGSAYGGGRAVCFGGGTRCPVCNLLQPCPRLLFCVPGSWSLEPLQGPGEQASLPLLCIPNLRLYLSAALISPPPPTATLQETKASSCCQSPFFLCPHFVFILCLFFTVILVEPQKREKMGEIYILCPNLLLWNVCNLMFFT